MLASDKNQLASSNRKGFKLTDEVRNYVSLDVLGIYLRDFGVQLGYALDTLAMDVAINGNNLMALSLPR